MICQFDEGRTNVFDSVITRALSDRLLGVSKRLKQAAYRKA